MISDSFHYWVRPNLDVLYCLTNYDGSSFHSYEALILELSSCRPNIGRTNDILNAAWPYMACSQFIYRQSSFLCRSGSALDSSLSNVSCRLFILICLPWHTGIQFRFHLSFIWRQSWSVPLEWLRHSWHRVLVSCWLSPLAVVIAKTF